ncbi:MAG TPA: acetylxylan esterase [Bacteroidales bacterium]|nr:acetylxylan esterase [Bacteroidales bacterium]HOX75445.1 acetylxylan esterase [Bacteroidales bacterium]HPM88572.1 acetylxylan esterase [Bacteroidales bacterium]HQM70491.1 acetylxylan esterase [Bacteroidales bacterium]
MKNNRRNFIKLAGAAGIGLAGNKFYNPENFSEKYKPDAFIAGETDSMMSVPQETGTSMIGPYGPWAAGLTEKGLPALSFRRQEYKNIEKWRKKAKKRLEERLGMPDIGGIPSVTKVKEYNYDGLHIEELRWQLPYGRPTDAILLKPQNATGKLPGILGFHDHGGNKYFGTRKITKTSDKQHPLMVSHQKEYYEGKAWANEIARRGYVVIVPDAFPFASRRVMMQDVPASQRQGLTDNDPENPQNIEAYNRWAGQHEHIMAKSLFCAGTTWPGVFLAEDMKAIDILCSRDDVDDQRIGCAGLSGGGMRTVFAGGFDSRIKCAVCVGFMTTWKDFLLNKSFTHTWMTYVPILPNELDFPEILGLRVPLPTLVLNDMDDSLYTPDGMKSADNILREVFEKAEAGSKYKCSFYPGPHKFDAAMQKEAFDWFDKWLKSS